jgi:formate hydrogenlyase subunit 6/NADH:ubiquinone oxidoreductase subunit I
VQTNFTLAQLADHENARSEHILRKCVHCGFCTATCPTFVLLGDEEEPDIEAVDAFDNMAFHGAFASQFAEALASVPEGHRLTVDITEEGIAFSTVAEDEPAGEGRVRHGGR